jgi:hypothetical protein
VNTLGVLLLLLGFGLGGFFLFFGRIRRMGVILLAIAALSTSYFMWRDHRFDSGYSKVEIGTSRIEVEKVLGKPIVIGDCSTNYYGKRNKYDKPPAAGCVQEYWYYFFFYPGALEFSFDRNDRVIFKYPWMSP